MKKTDWSKIASGFRKQETKNTYMICNSCVYRRNSWFDNPCYRCGETNNHAHFEEDVKNKEIKEGNEIEEEISNRNTANTTTTD